MTETWWHLTRTIEALHRLRQVLEAQGKRELADMASDCIRAMERMYELLDRIGPH